MSGTRADGVALGDVIGGFARLLKRFGDQLADSVIEANADSMAIAQLLDRLAAAQRRIEAMAVAAAPAALLRPEAAEIRSCIDGAIVAMQYQDRLAQRIGHIGAGLGRLEWLLCDRTERSPGDWLALLRDEESLLKRDQDRLRAVERGCGSSVELFGEPVP